MKNIVKVWSSSVAFLLSAFSFLILVSCSQGEDFVAPTDSALRVVLGDFPAFGGNPQTRASINGTPDAGKTQWAENDEIIITVKSEKYGTQYATLTYDGEEWCFDDYLKYLEGENEEDGTLEITALYAPCYEVLDDAISLKEGMTQGMDEYLEVKCHIENRGVLQIPFSQADRNYSRLRIAAMPEATLTVSTEGFTPAGATEDATEPYTLTTDDNGNAFLYGIFAEEATVSVKQGEVTLKDYTFTAEKNPNGTEPNKSYALNAVPQIQEKSIVFVEGVSRENGWYDVNKVGQGDNGDINMCWAASASNIIEWWQDRYVAAGNTLPLNAVTGAGETYELALMEVFHKQWNNDKGGQVAEAIPWYFEGVYYGGTATAGSQAYPLPNCQGGYFKDVWENIYPCLYHEYTYMLDMYKDLYVGEFNNYYLWGDGSNLQGKERLKYFTQLVVDFVDRGIASLTVSLSSTLSGLLHSTTIWGYEIDNTTGLLTRLWLTDSDDLEKEPKMPLLNEYEVSVEDGNSHIKLSSNSVRYGACYAAALIPVSGYKK